jgi:mRNA-degrading endonuclease RelE of RelBE toxin-antitoxin system
MTGDDHPVPARRVRFTRDFTHDVKRLKKKYRQVEADVTQFINRLKRGETPGNQISGIQQPIYKARVRNTALQRGKSGGYWKLYDWQTLLPQSLAELEIMSVFYCVFLVFLIK